jgi:hypothetical protein
MEYSEAYFVRRMVKPGDLITHISEDGQIQEHIFTEMNGWKLSGTATKATMELFGCAQTRKDIRADAVIGINRWDLTATIWMNGLTVIHEAAMEREEKRLAKRRAK